MKSQHIFAWSCITASVFLASAGISSAALADTAPSAAGDPINSEQVNANAKKSFKRLDGDGADKTLQEDASEINAQMGQPSSQADQAPVSQSAQPVIQQAAAPAQQAAEAAPAPAAEAPASVNQHYTQVPPNSSSASVSGSTSAVAAAAAQPPSCTVGRAPGRRQPSRTAKRILCSHAVYDLGCQNGAIEISVIASGSPWVFNARGCGMEATYHMVGNSISYIGGSAIGDPEATVPERQPVCAVHPYAGRQVSDKAKAIICNQSRYDLQCPTGDLYITVLRIGLPPYSWLFAVDGCGYSVRYSMLGDILSRIY